MNSKRKPAPAAEEPFENFIQLWPSWPIYIFGRVGNGEAFKPKDGVLADCLEAAGRRASLGTRPY
jgi:hypothetical protein